MAPADERLIRTPFRRCRLCKAEPHETVVATSEEISFSQNSFGNKMGACGRSFLFGDVFPRIRRLGHKFLSRQKNIVATTIVVRYISHVAGRLADEIKQNGPFSSPQAEAVLNILQTAEAFLQSSNLVLKRFDLTLTQFNVLRVLRDAGGRGIACSELGERLVARDPDITRLLDRMEQKHLVHRDRSVVDRRVVVATIAREGLKTLKESEGHHYKNMERIMGALSNQEVFTLTESLERVRGAML